MAGALSGREDRGQLTLCLISTTSHRAVAGLSAYVRGIARSATAAGWDVSTVARFEADGRRGLDPRAREGARLLADPLGPLSIIGPAPGSDPLLRVVRPLIHRQSTQALSIRAFETAYRRPLARAMAQRGGIVHFAGCGWELLGFPALTVARRRGLRFSVLPAMHPGDWGDSELDARLYRSADLVFALSRHEADRLVELGVDPARVRLTPLAPSLPEEGDGARFRAQHGLGDRRLVLFTGRKEPYKGYHVLAAAIAQLVRSHPDVVLVAAGPQGTATDAGVPHGALLDLGVCDEATKADALAACDVFCMPSAGEAFGIVYTEAWTHGKPVVGGPAPAARELIQDAGGGLSVERQSADEVADALARLLADPELRRRLGEAGRASQRERYTWDAAWRVHEDAWRGLEHEHAPAAALSEAAI